LSNRSSKDTTHNKTPPALTQSQFAKGVFIFILKTMKEFTSLNYERKFLMLYLRASKRKENWLYTFGR